VVAIGRGIWRPMGPCAGYLLGNWSAPFGIALALDALSAPTAGADRRASRWLPLRIP